MNFWWSTWSNILGGIGAGLFFVLLYVLIQWFLRVTDLLVAYNWAFVTLNGITYFRPAFDIRNRSGSRVYRLANIAYTRDGVSHWFDNESIRDLVLEPGSINNFEAGPVRNIHTLQDALNIQITIRTQSGRSFWLRGIGPGQLGKGRIQRMAFWLRNKLDSTLIPME